MKKISEMSQEELDFLGISRVGRATEHCYFVPHLGEIVLSLNGTIHDVYFKIYQHSHNLGFERGKDAKIEEIKKVLDII